MNNCAVILAGGRGTRMKSESPKVMCEVLGEPMIKRVLKACEGAEISDICVVTGYGASELERYLDGKYETAYQSEQKGTGHAVMMAEDFIKNHIDSNVIILCGDAPFIDSKTILDSLSYHTEKNVSATVVTAELEDPYGYGRIVRCNSEVLGIVEHKDCSEEQRLIKEVNSGTFWFNAKDLLASLSKISTNNSQGEYYLTDTLEILRNDGKKISAYISENKNLVMGANDRKGLLKLNEILRNEIIEKHLDNGVEIVCKDGIIIESDVKISEGVKLLPGVILKGNTSIGKGSVIGPNCIIENTEVGENTILNNVQAYSSKIGSNVKVGPFVHLRANSVLADGVKVGDFVEVKNSNVGKNTALAHLTYIGDSDIGEGCNFGCGVVTVNYDGDGKYRTTVKDHAFIGCNTNIIAPVTIGNCAYTAAGSTITKDVPDGALGIERTEQINKEGYGFRKLIRFKDKHKNKEGK